MAIGSTFARLLRRSTSSAMISSTTTIPITSAVTAYGTLPDAFGISCDGSFGQSFSSQSKKSASLSAIHSKALRMRSAIGSRTVLFDSGGDSTSPPRCNSRTRSSLRSASSSFGSTLVACAPRVFFSAAIVASRRGKASARLFAIESSSDESAVKRPAGASTCVPISDFASAAATSRGSLCIRSSDAM